MDDIEPVVWEDDDFQIRLPKRPHVDRDDGGHLVVYPKRDVSYRSELSVREAQKLAVLLQALEAAYIVALRKRGLKIIWLNFQDNGNWSFLRKQQRHFHIHVYGRSEIETRQTPGQALFFPDPKSSVYDTNRPLNEKDLDAIIERLNHNIAMFRESDFESPCPLGKVDVLLK